MCRVVGLCIEWVLCVEFYVSSFMCRVLCIELYVWSFICRVGVLCRVMFMCRFFVSSFMQVLCVKCGFYVPSR